MVELLLKADGVDVNKGREDGTTPLFIAAQEGHTSVVELLLKADGVDVNKAKRMEDTPLYIAAQEGHASVVELLLKADGVDVNKGMRMEQRLCLLPLRRSLVRGRVTVES